MVLMLFRGTAYCALVFLSWKNIIKSVMLISNDFESICLTKVKLIIASAIKSTRLITLSSLRLDI